MKILLLVFFVTLLSAQKPELLLLKNYKSDQNISNWYMSEKLDGVRAYWDGKNLISRSGHLFKVPPFFIKDFPKFALDGELWSKRDDFSNISSIVNRRKEFGAWHKLSYNVFEVPNAQGGLLQRLSLVDTSQYIHIIKQVKIKNSQQLYKYLKYIESLGGEGLVVRDGSLPYYTGRKLSAVKLKSYKDRECEVIAYTEGRGKYQDKVGALLCKMDNQQVLKIGSGLKDKDREHPPKIGAIITFKYYGLTSKGNPRFPIYMRVRK